MSKRRIAAASLVILAGCAREAPPAGTGAAPPGADVTLVTRAAATLTGQPIASPPQPVEVVVSTADIPAGGALPMHRHPWPRYFYVERGSLRVSYEQAGLVRDFTAGEAGVEAVDQWHEARVLGDEPVRIIVFDQVPPGRTNVVGR